VPFVSTPLNDQKSSRQIHVIVSASLNNNMNQTFGFIQEKLLLSEAETTIFPSSMPSPKCPGR
jgi:hypothetical protein